MPLTTVLCPVDLTEASRNQVALAGRLCQRAGARLVLVHDLDTLPPAPLSVGWMYSAEEHEREKELERRAEEEIQKLFPLVPTSVPVEARLTRGAKGGSILHLAEILPADLILMATHDTRPSDLSSVTERVVEDSPCAVLALHDAPDGFLDEAALDQHPVLVPVDFSPASERAVDYAFGLASWLPVRIILLHVEGPVAWQDLLKAPPSRIDGPRNQRVEAARQRLEAMVPKDMAGRVEVRVSLGAEVPEIVSCACQASTAFLVMPTEGTGLMRRLLHTSAGTEVLHRCHVPVWFVPSAVRVAEQRELAATA